MTTQDPDDQGAVDDVFAALVSDLSDLEDLDTSPALPDTPVLDTMFLWKVAGDRIVVTDRRPEIMFIAGIARAAARDNDGSGALANLDVDAGDLRRDSVAAHSDELATESSRCLNAVADLASGGIPVAACFDAARGFQHLRLRVTNVTSNDVEESQILDVIGTLCAALSSELIDLALAL